MSKLFEYGKNNELMVFTGDLGCSVFEGFLQKYIEVCVAGQNIAGTGKLSKKLIMEKKAGRHEVG
ncbi:MAG: hypothetical protein ABIH83_04760 [Candidatus Micrarchaeota archaeon]